MPIGVNVWPEDILLIGGFQSFSVFSEDYFSFFVFEDSKMKSFDLLDLR